MRRGKGSGEKIFHMEIFFTFLLLMFVNAQTRRGALAFFGQTPWICGFLA
jgi:hypothetical protein